MPQKRFLRCFTHLPFDVTVGNTQAHTRTCRLGAAGRGWDFLVTEGSRCCWKKREGHASGEFCLLWQKCEEVGKLPEKSMVHTVIVGQSNPSQTHEVKVSSSHSGTLPYTEKG